MATTALHRPPTTTTELEPPPARTPRALIVGRALAALAALLIAATLLIVVAASAAGHDGPAEWPTAPEGSHTDGWPPHRYSECSAGVAGGLDDPCVRSHTAG